MAAALGDCSVDATTNSSSCTISIGSMSIILALPGKTLPLAAPDALVPVKRSLIFVRSDRPPVPRLRLMGIVRAPVFGMSIILALLIEWVIGYGRKQQESIRRYVEDVLVVVLYKKGRGSIATIS